MPKKKEDKKESIFEKYPSSLDVKPENIERFSSGSIGLDLALGGGYPRGRVIELYGPESSGKTTIALEAIAELNKLGEHVAYVDTEQSYDPTYSTSIGIVPEFLHIVQPNSAEEALQAMVAMAESGEFSCVVLDSVAALVPQAELDGEVGDSTIGKVAKLMAQTLRKITGPAARTKTTIIFINQLREMIGIQFGSPEITTGGKSLKFYASVRLDVRRKKEKDVDYDTTNVKVVKNKTAPPFGLATFTIKYGVGIDSEAEILDLAVQSGVVQQTGSWFNYEGTKLGQGRDKSTALLRDNPELTHEIREKLLTL